MRAEVFVVDGPISAEFVVQNALSAASSLVVTNGARLVGRYPLGVAGSTQPITIAPDSTPDRAALHPRSFMSSHSP